MLICDLDKVDAVGEDRNENALRLMLADHLDWEHEGIHLEILQDKLNLYIQYIESKQYVEEYGDEISIFYIDIYFAEKITRKCRKFLKRVEKQLNPLNIYIETHFD